jgi:hypothetical protein
MKKIGVVFIFLVFIVFAYLGFKAASKLLPATNANVTNQDNESEEIAQQNFLIYHVDDLQAEKPALISIWAAFVYPSTPPQIMFLPLFPSMNTTVHEKLMDRFALTRDGEITLGFQTLVNRIFELKSSAYILGDHSAVGNSMVWMTGKEPPTASTSPVVADEEKKSLLAQGQSTYSQFCQMLQSGSGNAYYSAINWSTLLPDHFVSSLSFDELILETEKVLRVGPIGQCSIITPP